MSDDLRTALADALRTSLEQAIVAEWICCDPPRPDHDLCMRGCTTLGMVKRVLAGEPEGPQGRALIVDALMVVVEAHLDRRDEVVEQMMDRITTQHMTMRVLGDPPEAAVHADWCTACKYDSLRQHVEQTESVNERLRAGARVAADQLGLLLAVDPGEDDFIETAVRQVAENLRIVAALGQPEQVDR